MQFPDSALCRVAALAFWNNMGVEALSALNAEGIAAFCHCNDITLEEWAAFWGELQRFYQAQDDRLDELLAADYICVGGARLAHVPK
jgi:hypothetical protein